MRKLNQILGNIQVCSIIIVLNIVSTLALYVAIFIYLFQKPIPQHDYFKVAIVGSVTFVLSIIVSYIMKKGFIKSSKKDLNDIATALSMLGTGTVFAVTSALFLCAFGIFH